MSLCRTLGVDELDRQSHKEGPGSNTTWLSRSANRLLAGGCADAGGQRRAEKGRLTVEARALCPASDVSQSLNILPQTLNPDHDARRRRLAPQALHLKN